MQLANRFGEDAGERVSVKQISVPNLGDILDLPRHSNFSLFVPKHRRLAGKLINIFLGENNNTIKLNIDDFFFAGVRSIDDLLSVAVYCRDRVNPYLFNYSLSVALLHRPDTKDVDIPSFIRSFPDKFVDSQVFVRAREEASIVPEGSRVSRHLIIQSTGDSKLSLQTPIEIPKDYTASNLEEEHRLAYFREDIGINLHHWHWHLVYPFEAAREVVAKNRRGELFYYMHQQIIAR